MSIETLLEAAKFLEFQAQQQQKARGKFVFYWEKKLKINKSSLAFHTLAVRSGNQSTYSVKGLVSELRGNPACGSFSSTVSEPIPVCHVCI